MPAPLVVSAGEPAGIGPDILIDAWTRREAAGIPAFYVRGDAAHIAARARLMGRDLPVEATTPALAASVFPRAIPVVPTGAPATALPGRPDEHSAPAAIRAIETAVADVLAGDACAIVTAPIAKEVLTRAGFAHPGHTEFLGELASRAAGHPVTPVMMLWCETLATVPVTVHIPLAQVPGRLDADLIVAIGTIVARDLTQRFGVPRPRLAVAGLNPHAGESGTMGLEDRDIIAPAVDRLIAAGIVARGPLPADTMFHPQARAGYDAALCMYHDQALIPIKTLAFHDAVNVTLGLPFVRTSPDHGTAFDIAGTGRADPSSFIAALRLAARIAPS